MPPLNIPVEIDPEDWRQYAINLAGQVFDLQIALIALRRESAEAQAPADDSESATVESAEAGD